MARTNQHTPPRYVFTEIPQNAEGALFITLLKKYLNRRGYGMRVRAQHGKPGTYAGNNWGKSSLKLDEATHFRVYIDKLNKRLARVDDE